MAGTVQISSNGRSCRSREQWYASCNGLCYFYAAIACSDGDGTDSSTCTGIGTFLGTGCHFSGVDNDKVCGKGMRVMCRAFLSTATYGANTSTKPTETFTIYNFPPIYRNFVNIATPFGWEHIHFDMACMQHRTIKVYYSNQWL